MPNEETVNKIKKSQVADNKSADIIFMTKVKPPQIEHQEIINNGNPYLYAHILSTPRKTCLF